MKTTSTLDTPEQLAGEQEEPSTPSSNIYLYPEFAGYEGEHRLKALLRKILPLALYRTWEVLVERQAPGNDCFLSIASVAKIAERTERTIRLNIHEFKARHLLVLRPEPKLLRQPDQSLKRKLVIVKDFSGLYALADEYLRWTESDRYIEPERDFADTIRSDETLKRKVMRFNNYRRIMENTVPGPKPSKREEHQWYTQYTPESESQALGTAGGTSAPRKERRQAERTEGQTSALFRQRDIHAQAHGQQDAVSRESFDAEVTSEKRDDGDTHHANEHPHDTSGRSDAHCPTTHQNPTNPSPIAAETATDTRQASEKERADLDEQAQAFVRRALSADNATQETLHGHNAAVKATPNRLVSAFVREVSPLFCDQNVKASLTRALRAVEQTRLSQKDILACLVKAYVVTQATKQVREQYRRPDGAIKMPLFCTLFVRFIAQCAAGTFGYTDAHLAHDIASDDRLVLFIVEHQLEATVLEETAIVATVARNEGTQEALSTGKDEETTPPVAAQSGSDDHEMLAEAEQAEPPQQPQHLQIRAEVPELGWHTFEAADWWAKRLRDTLGDEQYNYTVCPTQYGRYGFVFFVRRTPSDAWAFLTRDEVSQYL